MNGSNTRQASVRRGLEALAGGDSPDIVLIHDGVRPFVSSALISRVVDKLAEESAVLPALPVTATLKAVKQSRAIATVPREGLFAAETPQGFRFDAILAAHRKAAAAGLDFTDDAAVASWAGIEVSVVAGDPANVKLTTADEIAAAADRLAGAAALAAADVRVGIGFDVHAYGPGVEVMLGGVAIPHIRGVIGHSDGDVVLHALTDAVLGAIGDGDIGEHFPPSDPQWKGASSDRFLKFAVDRVRARGGQIGNLDVTVVAEAPKLAEHRVVIRKRIAEIAGIPLDCVGMKATTNENLGFIGRGEGISAMATASVRLPHR